MPAMDYLNRLVSAFHKKPEKPIFSPYFAVSLSVVFTLIYIVPFYLSKETRPSPQLARDAPSSIRARIRAVTLSSILSATVALWLILHFTGATPSEAFYLLGWWPISLLDAGKTVLLTAILFTGPLFEAGVVEGRWRYWIRPTYAYETLASWKGTRNYIAGPATEELIWRSILIPLHLLAHISPKTVVFVTPLYFGLAHVHHCYETRLTNPNMPFKYAIIQSAFQFSYTSLFGFYAGFVFLRNREVLGLILTHSFCNFMGLPRFWGRVGPDEDEIIYDPAPSERDKSDHSQRSRRARTQPVLGIQWTVAYYTLLVAGAVGFYFQLFPLTKSDRALATFE